MENKIAYSIKHFAGMMDVSPRTVYNWIARGILSQADGTLIIVPGEGRNLVRVSHKAAEKLLGGIK